MSLLFHQITICIIVVGYVPIILAHYICMLKEKKLSDRLCWGSIVVVLILNLPNIIKNYQQYIMNHFSGLSETITSTQITADIIAIILFVTVLSICTALLIAYKRFIGSI